MKIKEDYIKYAVYGTLAVGSAYFLLKSRLVRKIAAPLAGFFLPMVIDKGLKAMPEGKSKSFLEDMVAPSEREVADVH